MTGAQLTALEATEDVCAGAKVLLRCIQAYQAAQLAYFQSNGDRPQAAALLQANDEMVTAWRELGHLLDRKTHTHIDARCALLGTPDPRTTLATVQTMRAARRRFLKPDGTPYSPAITPPKPESA